MTAPGDTRGPGAPPDAPGSAPPGAPGLAPGPSGADPLPAVRVPVFRPPPGPRRGVRSARFAALLGAAAAAIGVAVWRGGEPDPAATSDAPAETSGGEAAPSGGGVAPSEAASLAVDSGPRGAHVFVDGEHRGRTPLRLARVPAGKHTVRLELRGYQEHQAEVSVRAGRAESYFAPLTRRPGGP